MAEATCLVAGASGTTLDDGVCFPNEFFVMADAFALDQVIHFGSLANVIDSYGELCPLHGATLVGNGPLASPPLPGLLGADLKVLA